MHIESSLCNQCNPREGGREYVEICRGGIELEVI
jgi:hypothetical protein